MKNLYLTDVYTDAVKGQYIVLYEAESATLENYKNSEFRIELPYDDEADESIFVETLKEAIVDNNLQDSIPDIDAFLDKDGNYTL